MQLSLCTRSDGEPRRVRVMPRLTKHTFPPFYACYLLKSIQSPLSKATYIGSTPSPPRRIRQHNGELTQGARKTRHKRPWVMQMIVHGFPSRLAALQFEWAWQHPHVSRHLRDPLGNPIFKNSASSLKKRIETVRAMVSNHPFSKWPLHVKLFTQEAVDHWEASTQALPLPIGFTCCIELEGVDGKSGKTGSGRKGPLSVTDEQFTSAILAKNTALVASGVPLECSVCKESLDEYAIDALTTCLCPTPECTTVSHIICLSRHFLNGDAENMIPRGGHCTSCRNYILWGDIVRGSYRRDTGGSVPQPADDEQDEASTSESDLEEHLSAPDRPSTSKAGRSRSGQKSSKASNEGQFSKADQNLEKHPTFQSSETHRIKATSTSKPRKSRQKKSIAGDESSGESFDFHSESSSGSTRLPLKKTRGRPRKVAVLTSTTPESCQKNAIIGVNETSGESSDLQSERSTAMTPQKSKPRKSVALTSMPRKSRQKKAIVAGDESSGESFDFDSERSTELASQPPKKTRGRPRKFLDSFPVPQEPVVGSYSSTALSISEKHGDSLDLNGISYLEAAADSVNEPAAPAQRSGNVVRLSPKLVLPTCDKQLVSTTALTRTMGGLSIGSSPKSTRKPLVDVAVIEVSD